MHVKRLLLITPLVVIAILLQAWFWVPSFDDPAGSSEARKRKFIEVSIGDAKLLNPILHADSASGKIVDKVFDGLLALNEDLALTGKLAERWTLSEQAYLLVPPEATLADGRSVPADELAAVLNEALRGGRLPLPEGLLRGLEYLPPRLVRIDARSSQDEARTEPVAVSAPPRIRFALTRVDPRFHDRLKPLLGASFAQDFDYRSLHAPVADEFQASLREQLLERYPPLRHNPEILFHLRRDVQFHDGEAFDADDVQFTYDAIMNTRNLSPRTSDFEPIKQLQVIDAHTVRVVYKRLFSPAVLAWTIGILPQHLLNDAALAQEMDKLELGAEARAKFGLRDSTFNRRPVGTGAFRFGQWRSDEFIELHANDAYWAQPPLYRHYYYRVIPDTLTREMEFRTGAADTYTPEPYQVDRYRQDERYQLHSNPTPGYSYIAYNNRRPPFDDARVRLALGMAVNVEQIIDYLLYGEGERVTGPYPKTTNFYPTELAPIAYDPQRAIRMLEDLGWRRNADGWLEKDGRRFEFNLITNNGNEQRRNILSVAQDAWRRIGVKCNTEVFEWAVFLEDYIYKGDFDAVVLGWKLGVDADQYQLWHSSQAGPRQLNFAGYDNPRADALIEAIREEYDLRRQSALARELHSLIAADQPYTFLYTPNTSVVLDPRIVMENEESDHQPLRADRAGDIYYFFNRWRKLAQLPAF